MKNDDNYMRMQLRNIFRYAPPCRIKSRRAEVFIGKWDAEMQSEKQIIEEANKLTMEQIKGRKWK